jgi:hypothetical protein
MPLKQVTAICAGTRETNSPDLGLKRQAVASSAASAPTPDIAVPLTAITAAKLPPESEDYTHAMVVRGSLS